MVELQSRQLVSDSGNLTNNSNQIDSVESPLNLSARNLAYGNLSDDRHLLQSKPTENRKESEQLEVKPLVSLGVDSDGFHTHELNQASSKFNSEFIIRLKPHYQNVEKALDSFLGRRDLTDRQKIQLLGDLTEIIQGKDLTNPAMIEPERRKLLAAGILDNLGFPHWIDQGAHPTCAFASNEERFYTGLAGSNPDVVIGVVRNLKELALTGSTSVKEYFGEKMTKVNLDDMDFIPDQEATADQGTDDFRNYASQIWQYAAMKNPGFGSAYASEEQAIFSKYVPENSSKEKELSRLALMAEKQPVEVVVAPDSNFNQILTGSNPYKKLTGHSLSLYRQRDELGKPVFSPSGQPLYFLSNQAGKGLDIKNLTFNELAAMYENYHSSIEDLPRFLQAGALTGLEPRYKKSTDRWISILERRKKGVGKIDREMKFQNLLIELPEQPK